MIAYRACLGSVVNTYAPHRDDLRGEDPDPTRLVTVQSVNRNGIGSMEGLGVDVMF